MTDNNIKNAATSATLREATESDIELIQNIFNDVLLHSTATFEEIPKTYDDVLKNFEDKKNSNIPFLVATIDQTVVGYATFGAFRKASGYKTTIEHSVHIAKNFRGIGLGSLLLKELITRARKQNYHSMIAAIDSDNKSSLNLHLKYGFKIKGELSQVAFKFSRWLDLTLMELHL